MKYIFVIVIIFFDLVFYIIFYFVDDFNSWRIYFIYSFILIIWSIVGEFVFI